MKIASIQWQGVRVPFREPFVTAAGAIEARYSLFVWFTTDQGFTGIGEAPASLIRGETDLNRLVSIIKDIAPSLIWMPIKRSLEAPRNFAHTEALSFAFETAILDAQGKAEKRPLASLLGGQPRPVKVNAVIGSSSPEKASGAAYQAMSQGFSTIKLKVGGRPIHEDEEMLYAVRRVVGPGVNIRLDANRAWLPEDALLCVRRLFAAHPEYVEEPIKAGTIADLTQLRRSSPVPIALDESVGSRKAVQEIIEAQAADVLVLKAPRIGSLWETKALIETAFQQGMRVVVTSAFEMGVGLLAALHLASAMLPAKEVCGLGTGALLEDLLLSMPLTPQQGVLLTPAAPGLGVSIDGAALRKYGLDIKGGINV